MYIMQKHLKTFGAIKLEKISSTNTDLFYKLCRFLFIRKKNERDLKNNSIYMIHQFNWYFLLAVFSPTMMILTTRLIISCLRIKWDFACSRNNLTYIIDGPLPINCSSRSCHAINHRASSTATVTLSNSEQKYHEWFGSRKLVP